jgi:hypothetical protein
MHDLRLTSGCIAALLVALAGCKSKPRDDGEKETPMEPTGDQAELTVFAPEDDALAAVLDQAVETGVFYLKTQDCSLFARPDSSAAAQGSVPPGKTFKAKLAFCTDASPCKKEGMLQTYLCGARTDCWYGDSLKPPIQWIRAACVQGEKPFVDD